MNRKEPPPQDQPATLDDLFAKADNVPDNELAKTLKGKVLLDSNGEHVYLDNSVLSFPVKRRILVIALGLHALHRKGILPAKGLFQSVEWYANHVQIKPATVAQELSRLKRKHFVDRDAEGYGVPIWAIRQAIDVLQKGE